MFVSSWVSDINAEGPGLPGLQCLLQGWMDQSGFVRQVLQRIKPNSRAAVTTRTQVTMSFFSGIMRVHPNECFKAEASKRETKVPCLT